MTIGEIISLFSVIIAFISVLCAIKNTKKNDATEIAKRASENATINVKLDTISTTMTDIKYDISVTKNEVSKLSERMATVEASAKSAHKRIDSVEERLKQ